MTKGRQTIGNLSLFDVKSWSDYTQPAFLNLYELIALMAVHTHREEQNLK